MSPLPRLCLFSVTYIIAHFFPFLGANPAAGLLKEEIKDSNSATSVLQWMEQQQRSRNNRGLRPGFFMDDISGGNPSIFPVP